ncbi:LacI family transcriptional regulator [Bifidobacterium sp. DSM 109958]|uniref:LacI family transcriptional regulator n=1 Tax=Bifidobacterium moraviense TaxID=2675323 RepID=A0A7Y0F215_9BIFI|nr:LacI family DNA-binding transcriptional regulator [Bifidobacterium sp. DSM 109958]NMN00605.1 LacI family transcriptional regulator [Bifidobacterium sp. DSM 109958]
MVRSNVGGGRATLHDVAAAAGVSVTTVSNYLSGYPYMRQSTKDRVRKAIDELGYVANTAARTLKTGRTGLLTLSVSDLRQSYFAELAERIIAAARYRNYGVMIESTGLNRDREIGSIDSVRRRMTDGLITSPACMGAGDAAAFEGDYPLVMLGVQPFTAPCHHILVDNVQAAHDATAHLIKADCSRIALIGGAEGGEESSRTTRMRGYCEALREAGIPVRHELIREVRDWNALGGARAVTALFDDGIRPDGILACNDHLAFGVMRQLKDLGLAIPGDVRVVGFDNIDEARFAIPSLTTVDQSADTVAIKAVDSVIGQIEAGTRAPASVEHVPHSIVYRASSPEA